MTATDPEVSDLLDRAADAVRRARAAGADAAEAIVRNSASTSVGVRLGALEDVSRSEDAGMAIHVHIGQRSASVSTADMTPATLDALVERAVAMARLAPENPWSGLAPPELLFTGEAPDLDLADPTGEPEPAALRAMAEAAEDAARAVPGVSNSEGGSAGADRTVHAHVTSAGFSGGSVTTGYSLSASVLAGEGERMQRDYDWHSARHLADLKSADLIGRRAGERSVARLDPAPLRSGAMPVLFDPRVAGSIVGHLVSAMSGPAIARGKSFLADRGGETLFQQGITIVDDPHRVRGLRSHAHDGEGLPTHVRKFVDAGTIGPWLCDLASARQLGVAPTGHGSGGGGITTGNLTLLPGAITRDDLIADIEEGVIVTELIGQGADMLTGDYSRGASGWRIERGRIAGPVAGFTIAGNLLAMFADLVAANDLATDHATHVPTLRTDSMTVAGA